MAEGEAAQERPKRRRRVGMAEHRRIPPYRSNATSSIESAPATIPAISEATFSPAFAPLSVGTLKRSCARPRRRADSAAAIAGTSPPDDTRFGSSNLADTDRGL
jgi:hypothetical protein